MSEEICGFPVQIPEDLKKKKGKKIIYYEATRYG